jgi:hypothetical protein
MLYGVVGVSTGTLRALAAWKELVVVCLVLYVAIRAPLGFGPRVELTATDMTLGSLLGLAAVFLIGSHTIVDVGPTLVGQLYGFRDAVFFFALYFVGRAMPEVIDDPRTMRRLMLVGAVTSIIAVLELLLSRQKCSWRLASARISTSFSTLAKQRPTTTTDSPTIIGRTWAENPYAERGRRF